MPHRNKTVPLAVCKVYIEVKFDRTDRKRVKDIIDGFTNVVNSWKALIPEVIETSLRHSHVDTPPPKAGT